MDMELNLNNLYKLPWSKEDNPNGWIEPTTYCQLECPGCYRGLAEKNPLRIHEDISKIKSDIDLLANSRNIQTLSIAGGEPLLYPKLKEVITYAAKKGIKTKVFTNGFVLTKEKLEELKEAGATEFVIHIDRFQQRQDFQEFNDINELRSKFCDMFRKVGNINLGFIMPVSETNFSDLPSVIGFCKKNSDIINLVVLTPCKNVLPNTPNSFIDNNIKSISTPKLSEFLCNEYNSQPCAYLSKIFNENSPSWLFNVPIFFNNTIVGYLDSELYKAFQQRYYKRKGKYYFTIKGNAVKLFSFFPFFLRKKVLRIFWNVVKIILKNPKCIRNPLRYQVILIIDGPEKTIGGWDLCDGCPDAMIHNKELVPSCLLERIKKGEKILL